MQGAESIKLKGYNQSVCRTISPAVLFGQVEPGLQKQWRHRALRILLQKTSAMQPHVWSLLPTLHVLMVLEMNQKWKEMYFFPLWPTNPPVFFFFSLSILELVLNNWNWNHDEKWDCIILRTKLFVSEWRGEGGDLRRVSCYAGF